MAGTQLGADVEAKRMNAGDQRLSKRRVNGAVARNARKTFKRFRAYADLKMAFAALLIARMTAMAFAVIDNFQLARRESVGQLGSDLFNHRRRHHFFTHPLQSGASQIKLPFPSRKGALS